MRFQIDPDLMEEAVFLALRLRGSGAAFHTFDERRETLYRISDGEERDAAFAALYAGYFSKLDLAAPVRRLLNERPIIADRVSTFLLHRVFSPKEEGAELFGCHRAEPSHAGFNALLRLRQETLLDLPVLERLCRHEFVHLSDMLDPAFEYDHSAEFYGTTAAQQNLMRDRFVALWDLRVDAKLSAEGREGEMPRERHSHRFQHLFGNGPGWDQLFAILFDQALLSHLTHRDLLASALDPFLLPRVASLELKAPGVVTGSAPCPLCGFPTRVWAEQSDDWPQYVVHAIQAATPHDKPVERICKQCFELLAASGQRASRPRPYTPRHILKEA